VISVVLIARVRFYREGLAELFDSRPNFTVAATASDMADGVARVRELAPDVALVAPDPAAGLPMRELVEAAPGTRVVIIGVGDDDPAVVPLAEAGVAGYVTTDASAAEVVDVVERAARGEAPCPPRITATLLQRVATMAREQGPGPRHAALTAREHEIVALIDQGLSNKEIASGLRIEVPTVKNHVHNILEKLNVTRRGEAAAIVRRHL
jgi:two-component system nitrate/nitrite response regulator NarL